MSPENRKELKRLVGIVKFGLAKSPVTLNDDSHIGIPVGVIREALAAVERVEELEESKNSWIEEHAMLAARYTMLEAENKRLREAIERAISDHDIEYPPSVIRNNLDRALRAKRCTSQHGNAPRNG